MAIGRCGGWVPIGGSWSMVHNRFRVAIGGCRGMMDWGWVTISGGRFRMAIGGGRSWVMDRGMMDWGMVESGGMMDWGRMRNWVRNRVCNRVCNSGMRRSRAIKNGTSKLGFASDKGEEGEDCKYLKKILNHFLAHNTNTILKKVFQFRIDLINFFKITL